MPPPLQPEGYASADATTPTLWFVQRGMNEGWAPNASAAEEKRLKLLDERAELHKQQAMQTREYWQELARTDRATMQARMDLERQAMASAASLLAAEAGAKGEVARGAYAFDEAAIRAQLAQVEALDKDLEPSPAVATQLNRIADLRRNNQAITPDVLVDVMAKVPDVQVPTLISELSRQGVNVNDVLRPGTTVATEAGEVVPADRFYNDRYAAGVAAQQQNRADRDAMMTSVTGAIETTAHGIGRSDIANATRDFRASGGLPPAETAPPADKQAWLDIVMGAGSYQVQPDGSVMDAASGMPVEGGFDALANSVLVSRSPALAEQLQPTAQALGRVDQDILGLSQAQRDPYTVFYETVTASPEFQAYKQQAGLQDEQVAVTEFLKLGRKKMRATRVLDRAAAQAFRQQDAPAQAIAQAEAILPDAAPQLGATPPGMTSGVDETNLPSALAPEAQERLAAEHEALAGTLPPSTGAPLTTRGVVEGIISQQRGTSRPFTPPAQVPAHTRGKVEAAGATEADARYALQAGMTPGEVGRAYADPMPPEPTDAPIQPRIGSSIWDNIEMDAEQRRKLAARALRSGMPAGTR